MRNAVGIFGGVAGAIVVALVARYGFTTSDTRLDGAITAFFFAVIAVGGIGGPAVAVHLFLSSQGWAKAWGVVAGAIAAIALLANLSNSLGAIAGRADKTTAERTQASDTVKDARAELVHLAREREALPKFAPASADDVEAARAAVIAAEKVTTAECGDGTNPKQRGPRCREKESEEKAERDTLATVLASKGLTDKAAKIDAEATDARRKIEKAPPVSAVNPMAETLARVFHVQAEDAATWQQVVTVVVVELLIAFALIAFELLSTGHAAARTAVADTGKPTGTDDLANESPSPLAQEARTVPETVIAASGDTASVGRFMLACLPRAQGERASWAAIYARY